MTIEDATQLAGGAHLPAFRAVREHLLKGRVFRLPVPAIWPGDDCHSRRWCDDLATELPGAANHVRKAAQPQATRRRR